MCRTKSQAQVLWVQSPGPSVSSIQSFSRLQLFVTPWTAARQASSSFTNSRSSLKLMSIESVMFSSLLTIYNGEGNGNLLQYSCLESPVDRGACWAAVYGVSERTDHPRALSPEDRSETTTGITLVSVSDRCPPKKRYFRGPQ